MSKFDANEKIASVLKEIHTDSFRIPILRRGYERDSQRALKLVDSQDILAFRNERLMAIQTPVAAYIAPPQVSSQVGYV